MKPEEWKPQPLDEGGVDWEAKSIGEEIRKQMPQTFEEAFAQWGPLEITHVQLTEVHPEGWIPMYFLTALRGKPDIYFVAYDYEIPYFRQWVEYCFVQQGLFRALPRKIEMSMVPCRSPWLTDKGYVIIGDNKSPVEHHEVVCTLTELMTK